MLSIYSEFPLLGFEKQDESDLTSIYSISLLKANKGNNRTKQGIHSKLTKTRQRHQCSRSGVFNVSFKHVTHRPGAFIVNFEQENASYTITCSQQE